DLVVPNLIGRELQTVFRGPIAEFDPCGNTEVPLLQFSVKAGNDFAYLIRKGVQVRSACGKLLEGRLYPRNQRVTFGTHIYLQSQIALCSKSTQDSPASTRERCASTQPHGSLPCARISGKRNLSDNVTLV